MLLLTNLYSGKVISSTLTLGRGLPFSMYAPREVGGSSLLYIPIAYYMQQRGEGVQIACKIANVLNGRPCMLQHPH